MNYTTMYAFYLCAFIDARQHIEVFFDAEQDALELLAIAMGTSHGRSGVALLAFDDFGKEFGTNAGSLIEEDTESSEEDK